MLILFLCFQKLYGCKRNNKAIYKEIEALTPVLKVLVSHSTLIGLQNICRD